MEKTQGRPYYGPFLSLFSIRCFSIPGGFTLGSASSASYSSIGIGFDGIVPVDSVRSFASNFAVDTVRRMLLAAWIAYQTFMPLFIYVFFFFFFEVVLDRTTSLVSPELRSTSFTCLSASTTCVSCMRQHNSDVGWLHLAHDLAAASFLTPHSCCAATQAGTSPRLC